MLRAIINLEGISPRCSMIVLFMPPPQFRSRKPEVDTYNGKWRCVGYVAILPNCPNELDLASMSELMSESSIVVVILHNRMVLRRTMFRRPRPAPNQVPSPQSVSSIGQPPRRGLAPSPIASLRTEPTNHRRQFGQSRR